MGNTKSGAYSYKEDMEEGEAVKKENLKRDWNMCGSSNLL